MPNKLQENVPPKVSQLLYSIAQVTNTLGLYEARIPVTFTPKIEAIKAELEKLKTQKAAIVPEEIPYITSALTKITEIHTSKKIAKEEQEKQIKLWWFFVVSQAKTLAAKRASDDRLRGDEILLKSITDEAEFKKFQDACEKIKTAATLEEENKQKKALLDAELQQKLTERRTDQALEKLILSPTTPGQSKTGQPEDGELEKLLAETDQSENKESEDKNDKGQKKSLEKEEVALQEGRSILSKSKLPQSQAQAQAQTPAAPFSSLTILDFDTGDTPVALSYLIKDLVNKVLEQNQTESFFENSQFFENKIENKPVAVYLSTLHSLLRLCPITIKDSVRQESAHALLIKRLKREDRDFVAHRLAEDYLRDIKPQPPEQKDELLEACQAIRSGLLATQDVGKRKELYEDVVKKFNQALQAIETNKDNPSSITDQLKALFNDYRLAAFIAEASNQNSESSKAEKEAYKDMAEELGFYLWGKQPESLLNATKNFARLLGVLVADKKLEKKECALIKDVNYEEKEDPRNQIITNYNAIPWGKLQFNNKKQRKPGFFTGLKNFLPKRWLSSQPEPPELVYPDPPSTLLSVGAPSETLGFPPPPISASPSPLPDALTRFNFQYLHPDEEKNTTLDEQIDRQKKKIENPNFWLTDRQIDVGCAQLEQTYGIRYTGILRGKWDQYDQKALQGVLKADYEYNKKTPDKKPLFLKISTNSHWYFIVLNSDRSQYRVVDFFNPKKVLSTQAVKIIKENYPNITLNEAPIAKEAIQTDGVSCGLRLLAGIETICKNGFDTNFEAHKNLDIAVERKKLAELVAGKIHKDNEDAVQNLYYGNESHLQPGEQPVDAPIINALLDLYQASEQTFAANLKEIFQLLGRSADSQQTFITYATLLQEAPADPDLLNFWLQDFSAEQKQQLAQALETKAQQVRANQAAQPENLESLLQAVQQALVPTEPTNTLRGKTPDKVATLRKTLRETEVESSTIVSLEELYPWNGIILINRVLADSTQLAVHKDEIEKLAECEIKVSPEDIKAFLQGRQQALIKTANQNKLAQLQALEKKRQEIERKLPALVRHENVEKATFAQALGECPELLQLCADYVEALQAAGEQWNQERVAWQKLQQNLKDHFVGVVRQFLKKWATEQKRQSAETEISKDVARFGEIAQAWRKECQQDSPLANAATLREMLIGERQFRGDEIEAMHLAMQVLQSTDQDYQNLWRVFGEEKNIAIFYYLLGECFNAMQVQANLKLVAAEREKVRLANECMATIDGSLSKDEFANIEQAVTELQATIDDQDAKKKNLHSFLHPGKEANTKTKKSAIPKGEGQNLLEIMRDPAKSLPERKSAAGNFVKQSKAIIERYIQRTEGSAKKIEENARAQVAALPTKSNAAVQENLKPEIEKKIKWIETLAPHLKAIQPQPPAAKVSAAAVTPPVPAPAPTSSVSLDPIPPAPPSNPYNSVLEVPPAAPTSDSAKDQKIAELQLQLAEANAAKVKLEQIKQQIQADLTKAQAQNQSLITSNKEKIKKQLNDIKAWYERQRSRTSKIAAGLSIMAILSLLIMAVFAVFFSLSVLLVLLWPLLLAGGFAAGLGVAAWMYWGHQNRKNDKSKFVRELVEEYYKAAAPDVFSGLLLEWLKKDGAEEGFVVEIATHVLHQLIFDSQNAAEGSDPKTKALALLKIIFTHPGYRSLQPQMREIVSRNLAKFCHELSKHPKNHIIIKGFLAQFCRTDLTNDEQRYALSLLITLLNLNDPTLMGKTKALVYTTINNLVNGLSAQDKVLIAQRWRSHPDFNKLPDTIRNLIITYGDNEERTQWERYDYSADDENLTKFIELLGSHHAFGHSILPVLKATEAESPKATKMLAAIHAKGPEAVAACVRILQSDPQQHQEAMALQRQLILYREPTANYIVDEAKLAEIIKQGDVKALFVDLLGEKPPEVSSLDSYIEEFQAIRDTDDYFSKLLQNEPFNAEKTAFWIEDQIAQEKFYKIEESLDQVTVERLTGILPCLTEATEQRLLAFYQKDAKQNGKKIATFNQHSVPNWQTRYADAGALFRNAGPAQRSAMLQALMQKVPNDFYSILTLLVKSHAIFRSRFDGLTKSESLEEMLIAVLLQPNSLPQNYLQDLSLACRYKGILHIELVTLSMLQSSNYTATDKQNLRNILSKTSVGRALLILQGSSSVKTAELETALQPLMNVLLRAEENSHPPKYPALQDLFAISGTGRGAVLDRNAVLKMLLAYAHSMGNGQHFAIILQEFLKVEQDMISIETNKEIINAVGKFMAAYSKQAMYLQPVFASLIVPEKNTKKEYITEQNKRSLAKIGDDKVQELKQRNLAQFLANDSTQSILANDSTQPILANDSTRSTVLVRGDNEQAEIILSGRFTSKRNRRLLILQSIIANQTNNLPAALTFLQCMVSAGDQNNSAEAIQNNLTIWLKDIVQLNIKETFQLLPLIMRYVTTNLKNKLQVDNMRIIFAEIYAQAFVKKAQSDLLEEANRAKMNFMQKGATAFWRSLTSNAPDGAFYNQIMQEYLQVVASKGASVTEESLEQAGNAFIDTVIQSVQSNDPQVKTDFIRSNWNVMKNTLIAGIVQDKSTVKKATDSNHYTKLTKKPEQGNEFNETSPLLDSKSPSNP